MPQPVNINQILELPITGLGSKGEGIGSIDGFKIFVPYGTPGQTERVEITTLKRSYAIAKLLRPISGPCPYFGRCGGCQLQHLSYEAQLEAKRQRVADAFTRIAGCDYPVLPCVPSEPWHYRNKIQLPVQGGEMGLYAAGSHTLVPIEACLIHSEVGERVFKKIRPVSGLRYVLIRTATKREEVLVVLVTHPEADVSPIVEVIRNDVRGIVQNINSRTDNIILGSDYQTLYGEDHFIEELCGLEFKVSPASFFQVNTLQAENLYRHVVEPADSIIDAYCGVGTLSLLLAQEGRQVLGIEVVEAAIRDARENAERNKITNTTFKTGRVESMALPPADLVVLNPPRKGCDPSVLKAIKDTPRITYVSCDPATLARDAAQLLACGYQIKSIQPFDMFPQTAHVETVVKLSKRSESGLQCTL